jgi:branched-chain amino acid transport system ATP-binding protein
MLSVSGLRAGYGATVVLENINLALPDRQALAILGRNGVGKTTLLATLMGRSTLHSGTIELGGQRIERLPIFERARLGLGYVPQTAEIFRSLTVEENLTVATRRIQTGSIDRVYQLFPRLAERRRHSSAQLSGGEQRMLAIGRALMVNPAVLLLDEPFEGLAPRIADSLATIIRDLIADGLAIALVEHSVKRALEITDAALVLSRGRIVWTGTSSAMLSEPLALSRMIFEA